MTEKRLNLGKSLWFGLLGGHRQIAAFNVEQRSTEPIEKALAAGRRKWLMGKAYPVVRAEVSDQADRAPFDHRYATDHLPWTIRVFGARRGWRCWSRADPAVHYAFYEFADLAEAQVATGSEKIALLVADFDRLWGTGSRGGARFWKSREGWTSAPYLIAAKRIRPARPLPDLAVALYPAGPRPAITSTRLFMRAALV
jgi:hypothetical protein